MTFTHCNKKKMEKYLECEKGTLNYEKKICTDKRK